MRRRNSRELTPEPAEDRSRRGLLAGAAGALGLLAGETILSAAPAQAANGDPLVVGGTTEATAGTRLAALGFNNYPYGAFWVSNGGTGDAIVASGGGAGGAGVNAAGYGGGIGVRAGSIDGPGVYVDTSSPGSPYASEAVYAQSGSTPGTTPGATHCGVHGVTNSPSASAVWGDAVGGGAGVTGSTSTAGITGLQGVSGVNSGTGPGVKGESAGGAAVYGLAASGSEGVYAQSGPIQGTSPGATRTGVHGVTDSPANSGVWGEAVAGGYGVSGSTSTKGTGGPAGVFGSNQGTGPGVNGLTANGIGVYGLASGSGAGVQAANSAGGPRCRSSGARCSAAPAWPRSPPPARPRR